MGPLKVNHVVGEDGLIGLMRLHLPYIPDSSPPSQRQVIIFQGFPTACSRYFRTSRLEAEKSEARAFSRRVARLVSECLPQQIRPAGRANPFSCVLLLASLGYETSSNYSKVQSLKSQDVLVWDTKPVRITLKSRV